MAKDDTHAPRTLPIQSATFTPEVNAASTVLIVVTVIVTAIALMLQSPEKTEG